MHKTEIKIAYEKALLKKSNRKLRFSITCVNDFKKAIKAASRAFRRFGISVSNFNDTQKLLTEIKMLHPEAPIDDIWKDAVAKSRTTTQPVSYYLTIFKNGLRE